MYSGTDYIHTLGGREALYLQISVRQVSLRYGFCFKLTLSSWVNLKQVSAQLCMDGIYSRGSHNHRLSDLYTHKDLTQKL